MAKRPRRARWQRDVSGILLLDKAAGISSNKALQLVKNLFKASKAGHTGSLDPLATGLLPICLGEATKTSGFLLDSSKRYISECTLGVVSSTGDAEGEIIERNPVEVSEAQIETVLQQFRGEIAQIPPMHSAVHHKGQRLYELARAGIEVEREARQVTIHELSLRSLQDDTLTLSVHCSKGTYIRTLVEDIGQALGCGAMIAHLRRTSVDPFNLSPENSYSFAQLEALAEQGGVEALDQCLLPISSAVAHWPSVELNADQSFYLRQGQAVQVPQSPTEGLVSIKTIDGLFLGIGEVRDDGLIAPKRLLQNP